MLQYVLFLFDTKIIFEPLFDTKIIFEPFFETKIIFESLFDTKVIFEPLFDRKIIFGSFFDTKIFLKQWVQYDLGSYNFLYTPKISAGLVSLQICYNM